MIAPVVLVVAAVVVTAVVAAVVDTVVLYSHVSRTSCWLRELRRTMMQCQIIEKLPGKHTNVITWFDSDFIPRKSKKSKPRKSDFKF